MKYLLIFFLCYFILSKDVKTFNVKDYGAKGDGKTLDTDAIHKTFEACNSAGGGIVLFPTDGKYLTAPFNMTSHTEMIVEKGAEILGVQDKELYPIIAPLPSYGTSRDVGVARHQPLVFGANLTNVKISGQGKIDGQGQYWWDLHHKKELTDGRPRLVEFLWSKDIEISGLELANSGFWTLHPTYCENVYIHDLHITAPYDSPNTDGIDPDSSANVLIERCEIENGDDHIAIKSGMNDPGLEYNWPIRNVTVRQCKFGHGNGIAIGSETSGGIFDVYIHDIVLKGANKGCYLKTSYGRGNMVSGIRFENIHAYDLRDEMIDLDMNYDSHPGANKTKIPIVKDVSYQHLYAENMSGRGGQFLCLDESPCHGISLNDVTFKDAKEGWKCDNAYGTQTKVSPQSCLKEEV